MRRHQIRQGSICTCTTKVEICRTSCRSGRPVTQIGLSTLTSSGAYQRTKFYLVSSAAAVVFPDETLSLRPPGRLEPGASCKCRQTEHVTRLAPSVLRILLDKIIGRSARQPIGCSAQADTALSSLEALQLRETPVRSHALPVVSSTGVGLHLRREASFGLRPSRGERRTTRALAQNLR
jgi:hypothetical protein